MMIKNIADSDLQRNLLQITMIWCQVAKSEDFRRCRKSLQQQLHNIRPGSLTGATAAAAAVAMHFMAIQWANRRAIRESVSQSASQSTKALAALARLEPVSKANTQNNKHMIISMSISIELD